MSKSRSKNTSSADKQSSHSSLLTIYIQLVCLGLRDSYLVDCCLTNNDSVVELCTKLLQSLKPTTNSFISDLLILTIGEDIFIINQSILDQKLAILQSQSESNWSSSLIINLDRDLPTMSTHDELQSMKSTLRKTWQQVKYIPSSGISSSSSSRKPSVLVAEFIADELFLSEVGYPLLAGWLLGYSCVYKSVAPTSSLSALSLKQITLAISTVTILKLIESVFIEPFISSLQSERPLDLQVFTVPTALYSQDILMIIDKQRAKCENIYKSICYDPGVSTCSDSDITLSIVDVCFDSITL